ncbi:MAG: DUF3054 domain-containing protein [Halobacteriales archaeon]
MTARSARPILRSRVDVSRVSGILLAGDLLAIGLFVVAGEIRHGRPPATGTLTFLEFATGWLLAAVAAGAYRRDAVSSPGRTVLVAGGGWLLGASLGQLIRAVVEPGFYVAQTFFLVTLGVGGVLLVGWRLLAWATL